VDDSLPKAEAAARRAIELDANLGDGYVSLGRLQVARGKLLLADESYSKRSRLDANNPDALSYNANLLAAVGRLKESLAMVQRLRAIEPLAPIFSLNGAVVVWLNGQSEARSRQLEELPRSRRVPSISPKSMRRRGRYREAADPTVENSCWDFFPGIVQEAVRLLRSCPRDNRLRRLFRAWADWGFVYLPRSAAPIDRLSFMKRYRGRIHRSDHHGGALAFVILTGAQDGSFQGLGAQGRARPITGARKAGRNSAIPPPATISRASDGRWIRLQLRIVELRCRRRWSLRLFGGFELSALPGGEKVASLGTRERALLAFLALSPKGSQPRRKLAALLWGDATDETLLDNFGVPLCGGCARRLAIRSNGLIACRRRRDWLDAAASTSNAAGVSPHVGASGRSELEAARSLLRIAKRLAQPPQRGTQIVEQGLVGGVAPQQRRQFPAAAGCLSG